MRYNFAKLIAKAREMQHTLLDIQPKLRAEVNEGFQKFHNDALAYAADYDQVSDSLILIKGE